MSFRSAGSSREESAFACAERSNFFPDIEPRSGGIQGKSTKTEATETKSAKTKRSNAAGEKIAARRICRNFRDLAAGASTIKTMPR